MELKQYKNLTIEDKDLNERPAYYTSYSANPYVTRIRSKDVRTGQLKILKILRIKGVTTFFVAPGPTNVTTFTATVEHKLGRYVLPIGQMILDGKYYPLPFAGTGSIEFTATYTSVTKDSLTITISSAVFFTEAVDVDITLYLLRENIK